MMGGLERVEHETRVVGDVLRVNRRALEAVREDAWLGGKDLTPRQNAMALRRRDGGELVEERETDPKLVDARGRATVHRHQHRHDAGAMRGDPPQRAALGRGLAHEGDLTLLEVAQPTVDQLRRAAARARREVARLDQRDRHTPQRGLPRHARSRDTAADHQEINRGIGELREVFGAGLRLETGHALVAPLVEILVLDAEDVGDLVEQRGADLVADRRA